MNKFSILISLCAIVFCASCESEHKEKEELVEAKFSVTSPVRMDTSTIKDYVSQIRSIRHIELRALERGYLQKIFVDEGQFVKKGQPLFKIMPSVYEAELRKAQAEVNFAEIEYQNTKKLTDSNVVAPNELAMADAKLQKAKAEMALAQVHLDFTEIRAPFDGIIDRFLVRPGSLIEEGELLTSFSDNSEMWVYFNVPEAEYLEYERVIDKDSLVKVNLLMANNKIFAYEGLIETIEADFNNETGNIAFRATFPNPEGLLRHGGTGNILINVPFKNALLIPQKVTFEILDKRFVYVIDENDMVRSREITIAAEMPHVFVVSHGLEENDKVLLDGLRLVKEKDKISYNFVAPLTAISNLNLYAE
ncbi:MAG: membrane fusion protein (multidrug efflux system) [Candidatus Endobugula sp.]|jgi:membrane fusion protein (multidrug efflux system)